MVNLLASYLPYGVKNHSLEYFLSTIIPGDTVDIRLDIQNDKVKDESVSKFYYDGSKFIRMDYIIDYGSYRAIWNREDRDWEEKWKPKYCNEYIYPEHVLQFVGDDLKNFLLNKRCLIHVTNILNVEYNNSFDRRTNYGLHTSCDIGMHKIFSGCERRLRTLNNILINDTITLNTSDDEPIYIFYKNCI